MRLLTLFLVIKFEIVISNYIATGSYAGLCNRLRVLTTYYHLAQKEFNGSTLLFVWESNHETPAHFLELFQPIDGITFISMSDYDLLNSEALFSRSPHVTSYKSSLEILRYHKISINPKQWHHIRRSLYSLLKPVYFIQNIIDEFVKQNEMCQMSAIHVRHTDLEVLMDASNTSHFVDDDYFRFISTRPIGESIFLLTDNAGTQNKFLNSHPKVIVLERIMMMSNEETSEHAKKTEQVSSDFSHRKVADCPVRFGSRCTPVSQVVTEMFIAAHSKAFFGSTLSSVTETIHILRNVYRIQHCDITLNDTLVARRM